MWLSEIAKILDAPFYGTDVECLGVETDTRTLTPGALFVALTGQRYDGHAFLHTLLEKQARGAIVNRLVEGVDLPQIVVDDPLLALGHLAAHHRQQHRVPILGITGSCGKTTTRALLASILAQSAELLSSPRSYNNAIGLPLTLLKLTDWHQYAVLEMGMNHAGEIRYLTEIAQPNLVLITNVAPVHLEHLGSLEGIAKAKGEILEGLDDAGIAIFNADDPYEPYWRSLLGPSQSVITFGHDAKAEISAAEVCHYYASYPEFLLQTPIGSARVRLPLLGSHNVSNALGAAAAAYALGIALPQIVSGLESVLPEKNRLNEHMIGQGVRLLDDSYNSNPLSLRIAIDILVSYPGVKILVLGDMRELGPEADSIHREVGEYARQAGVDALYTYGTLTRSTQIGFGGKDAHFEDQTLLVSALQARCAQEEATILIKGSRGMVMENVVARLLEG